MERSEVEAEKKIAEPKKSDPVEGKEAETAFLYIVCCLLGQQTCRRRRGMTSRGEEEEEEERKGGRTLKGELQEEGKCVRREEEE